MAQTLRFSLTLQQNSFVCIIREIQHGVSALLSKDPSHELVLIDRTLCSYVICLLSWSKTVPGEIANTKHLVIKSLFTLSQIGSPRLQRLSLSLLSRILPSSIPSEVVSDRQRRHSVVSALIRRVGLSFRGSRSSSSIVPAEMLFLDDSSSSKVTDAVPSYVQWQGVHSGSVNFALSIDLISLMRCLLVSEKWKRDVASSLMTELRERKSEYEVLATCLAVLGGYNCVRSGGRIRNAGVIGMYPIITFERPLSSFTPRHIHTNTYSFVSYRLTHSIPTHFRYCSFVLSRCPKGFSNVW